MAAVIIMTDPHVHAQLALQAWLSPAYPVGAYAYSHGLETAADKGTVHDAASLEDWLNDVLRHGSGWNDAIFIAEVFRIHCDLEGDTWILALCELAELACAMTGTAELRQECLQQGTAFLDVTQKAWPHAALDALAENIGANTAYPVCFGASAAVHGCDPAQTINVYLFAMLSNWVSASVRMNIVGQSAGQQIAAALASRIETVTAAALASSLDDLGGCSFLNDIASFHHESQNARLFRS
jgi:urease accessory protein